MAKFDRDIFKTVVRIALPSVIESFFTALAGIIDSYMVSSMGTSVVAAVGLTGQPKLMFLAVFIAMNVSVSALVARRCGENRQREANEILVSAIALMLLFVAVVSVVSVCFADGIIHLCGSSPEMHGDAVIYFRIIMGGTLFNAVQMCLNAALRGIGDTRVTMRTNLVSASVNICFNYLLIGGHLGFPALGVRGAAIATVLGTVVSASMSVLSLIRSDRFLNLRYCVKNRVRVTLRACIDIAKVGYGVLGEQLLMRIGFLATAVMAAKLGNAEMAAHNIAMNMMSLSFSFGDGLQAAAVALIGRSLGENDPQKAQSCGKTCQHIGSVFAITLSVLYLIGGRWLMTIFFPNDPLAVSLGVGITRVIVVVLLFQVSQVIYMGCLRGAGDTLFTAVVSTISVTVIRTAVSYLFGYAVDLSAIGITAIQGVWFGILADQICRFICTSIRFRSGKWTKIKI